MLRIVGIQRSDRVEQEFVLLQNQGSLKACLRGHVLMSERAIRTNLADAAHVFSESESIHPGLYVLLSSGSGMPHWGRTKDGAHVYHAYAGRSEPLWSNTEGPVYVLSPCHTFVERGEALVLR